MPKKKPAQHEEDAAQLSEQLTKQFDKSLRGIAVHLAEHDRTGVVSAQHVSNAYAALCKVGLHRQPLLDRPETYQAIGGFSIGASMACPDLLNTLLTGDYVRAWSVGSIWILLTFGVASYVMGWYKARNAAFEEVTWRTWVFRVLIVLFFILLFLYTAIVVVARTTGRCCGGQATTSPIIVEGMYQPAPAVPSIAEPAVLNPFAEPAVPYAPPAPPPPAE